MMIQSKYLLSSGLTKSKRVVKGIVQMPLTGALTTSLGSTFQCLTTHFSK